MGVEECIVVISTTRAIALSVDIMTLCETPSLKLFVKKFRDCFSDQPL